MSFYSVIGQARPKEIIGRAVANGRVAHAYLFNGPEGVGKEAMAIELAKAIFCQGEEKPCDVCSACKRVAGFSHPDFIYIFPMPKEPPAEEESRVRASLVQDPYVRLRPWALPSIGIERIRELRRVSALKPLEGKRVVVIAEAEEMTPQAANALLKILEEPPPEMTLILTTSQPNSLLPTILSRCQEVRFSLLTDEDLAAALQQRKNLEPEQARLIASIAQGNYRRALECLDDSLQTQREAAVDFLRQCIQEQPAHVEWIDDFLVENSKAAVRDLLSLVLIWFRDALFLQQQEAGATVALVNVDKSETLARFISAFRTIRFEEAFRYLEEAIEQIDRNLQLNLILVVLMARLKQCLISKGSPS